MKGTRIIASRFGWLGIVFLVLAALSSAVLADADPAPPAPPVEHLLLVPDTPDAVVALTNSDARVVARYQSFALVEAAGEDDRRLRAAGAQRRDDMREVTTAAGPVDPAADRGSLAGKQAPDRGEVLALVQFVGPPKDAWVDRLRATGATIVTYQAENAYVVHASGAAVDRIAALVGTDAAVRAVIPVAAADKLVGPSNARGALRGLDGRRRRRAMTRGTRPRRRARRSALPRRSARCAPSTSSWTPTRWPSSRATPGWSRSSGTWRPGRSDERARRSWPAT